jgi:iron(III) transport system ATP-binding protein
MTGSAAPATGAALSVRAVAKSFGPVAVLRGVDLDAAVGSVTAVLGPSGCGKTTLLRLIAGFQRPDAGTIDLAGRRVSDARVQVPAEARGLGYLAQEGALFPHLTVARNITFGLPRRNRRDRGIVRELLDLVRLDPALADRYPHQLSGGQQQRVALARTMAPQPKLILLDEPFSALDTALRAETRSAVAAALSAAGVTAILVTHDQSEALSFADRVCVMSGGVFTQVGTPREVYRSPVDLPTAEFLGDTCVVPADLTGDTAMSPLGPVTIRRRPGDPAGGRVQLMLRPEQLRVAAVDPLLAAHQDVGVAGVTRSVDYFGHDWVVTAELLGPEPVVVTCRMTGIPVAPGTPVRFTVHGTGLVFPPAADSAGRFAVPAPSRDASQPAGWAEPLSSP